MATKIVMGINFALGVALTGVSLNVFEKTRKCTDVGFQRVIEGILIMSVALLVASIAYLICHTNCRCEADESPIAKTLFALYFIGVGVTLIILGAILHSKSKGNCSDAVSGAITTWSLGIVVLVGALVFFGFENWEQISGIIQKNNSK